MNWLRVLSLKTLSSLSRERTIVVICVNARNYFKVVNLLKEHDVKFKTSTRELLDSIPDVIITDTNFENLNQCQVLSVRKKVIKSPILLLEICRVILGKKQLDQIILGIDPGKETGIVLLSDGVLVLKRVVHDITQAVSLIREIIELAKFRELIVKIGISPSYQGIVHQLLKSLPKSEKMEVKLIDESRVSKLFKLYSKVLKDKNDNIVAAYAICLAKNCVGSERKT